MLINMPLIDNYIYINKDIPRISFELYPWYNTVRCKEKTTNIYSYVPFPLMQNEWYRVKNIIRMPKYIRNYMESELIIVLALDTRTKTREWVRNKIPSDYRIITYTVSIGIEAINRNSECYPTLDLLLDRIGEKSQDTKKNRFISMINSLE